MSKHRDDSDALLQRCRELSKLSTEQEKTDASMFIVLTLGMMLSFVVVVAICMQLLLS